MKNRTTRLLIIWNVVLTVLLLASLGVNAVWVQAATDPPIQVFTARSADVGTDFSQSTTQKLINSNSATTLLSVSVTLSTAHTHICFVMASADTNATNQASTHDVWLNMDSTAFLSGSHREVFFTGADNQEVTTLYTWTGITGTHTFYFLASGTPQMAVNERAMTVTCLRKQL